MLMRVRINKRASASKKRRCSLAITMTFVLWCSYNTIKNRTIFCSSSGGLGGYAGSRCSRAYLRFSAAQDSRTASEGQTIDPLRVL